MIPGSSKPADECKELPSGPLDRCPRSPRSVSASQLFFLSELGNVILMVPTAASTFVTVRADLQATLCVAITMRESCKAGCYTITSAHVTRRLMHHTRATCAPSLLLTASRMDFRLRHVTTRYTLLVTRFTALLCTRFVRVASMTSGRVGPESKRAREQPESLVEKDRGGGNGGAGRARRARRASLMMTQRGPPQGWLSINTRVQLVTRMIRQI